MFDRLKQQPDDPLLSLIAQFRADPLETKIDLGVGVYRDAQSETPVMAAVKEAEAILLSQQPTKAYLGPAGDMGFVNAIADLACADALSGRSWTGLQTPGGTGALRLACALIHESVPDATVWIGTPSWPIHAFILNSLGHPIRTYEHIDAESGQFNGNACLQAVTLANPGDVFLLHGCCHNPTGVDPDAETWGRLSIAMAEKDLLPLVDLAYHGLGDGLDDDRNGLKALMAHHRRLLIAYSCDKNFGLYRERTGALLGLCATQKESDVLVSNFAAIARVNWSMPPDHGAAVVRIILENPALKTDWHNELTAMQTRLKGLRDQLSRAGIVNGIDLRGVARQRGMFSILPLSPEDIGALREDHGIYMAGSGRINVAGFAEGQVEAFVSALDHLD